jgi:oxygen-independent coproporphyrinogen-3 oxidase
MTKRMLQGVKFSKVEPQIPQSKKLGLYIHIPFCKMPCPFCPYNRYPWHRKWKQPYVAAVNREIDTYREMLPEVEIETLYIGGGTPTVTVDGLVEILAHAEECFPVDGDICVEANPDDLDDSTLSKLRDIGVKKLSIGVQSFDDDILRAIGRRSHDGGTALNALKLAMAQDFDCVNADFLFSLPGQSLSQVLSDLETAVDTGVHQITTYPLLLFPYTKMAEDVKRGKIAPPNDKQERAMYDEIVRFLTSSGYEMCSIWSFAKRGVGKYGSVEREEYIGVGAGAMTMTNQYTYANTFPVAEYIQAVGNGLPIAVGTIYSEKPIAKWFMMRLYELGFDKEDYFKVFGAESVAALESLIPPFRSLGIIEADEGSVRVKPQGLYPVHEMTKTFLTTYIGRICEECLKSPWPDEFEI